jgi:two-component system CheB/CheR fusion protein
VPDGELTEGQAGSFPTPDAEPALDEEVPECRAGFPIVGIGASAGGLEALTELLEKLPADLGAALVFVQHLDPRHKSNLVEILGRVTRMRVTEISDGARLEPNCLYVMPPDRDVAVLHGVLHLMSRSGGSELHLPIDYFFRSLAQDQGNCAVGVVLSGTGSDGSSGLRAIKAEGGITFAQQPESAKYNGMPLSAAATGQVDFVLKPKDIAAELVAITRHPYIEGRRQQANHTLFDSPDALQKIFIVLRKATGVDFAHYKQSTVERRLSRRMALHKVESVRQYLRFLEATPGEVSALFEDMLINVTAFFREAEAFETLKAQVFPRIFENRLEEAPVRVWIPACSTGEEAYSIAIALVEYMQKHDLTRTVQIFATDVSDAAIERARSGKYLDEIAETVSPERLRRFFVKNGVGYQVAKAIRDLCVFAKQNVTKDPPFSNLDLLSCRNLLIYMGPVFQKRIIPTFHYALKPNGFLMLGQSETIGSFADLFSLIDRVHKIYAKKVTAVRLPLEFGTADFRIRPEGPLLKATPQRSTGEVDLQREADRLVLNQYAPPGVIVNGEMEILHFRGQTGQFLAPAPGAATLNLLKMAREGLALDLRAAIHKAGKKNQPVRKEGLQCRSNGGMLELSIEVIPIHESGADETYFLVLFEQARPAAGPGKAAAGKPSAAHKEVEQEAQRLREELAQTKETLQHIIEEHETTNEELRAANEEIQSANEELQSTNEELETAKEELQSTNEELTTLNGELESQNLELNQAVDDFNNLHNSVNIPVVLLGTDLRIRTFTPPAERSLRLIPADSGRPINELKLGIEVADLERKVLDVIQTLNTCEEEVRAYDGHWYVMRIRPYRTNDNKITGAVLALIDVHERKIAEHQLSNARILAESVLATVREPLLVLSGDLHVKMATAAFYRTFRVSPLETEGRPVYSLGNGQWNIPALRQFLERVIPHDSTLEDFEVEHEFPGIGRRRIRLNARRIDQTGEQPPLILLALEDMTDGSPRIA